MKRNLHFPEILEIVCDSELGTGKESCISKDRTGKEFDSQKWGPEKNFDLKTGTGKEL